MEADEREQLCETEIKGNKIPAASLSVSSQMGACHMWALAVPPGLSVDLELTGEGFVRPWMPGVCEQVVQQSNEDTQSNASIAESKKICKREIGGISKL